MAAKRVKKDAAPAGKKKKKSEAASPEITSENLFKHLKLLHIRLIDIQANVRLKGGKTPSKAKIEAGAGLGIGTEQKNLHVNGVVDVLARPDLDDADGSELRIHLEYQVVFQILDAPVDELLKFQKQLVGAGLFMVWPNFRETVMSITARMSIPPLVLPMFVTGASGVSLGGAEVNFSQVDIPPVPPVPQDSNRILGYHQ